MILDTNALSAFADGDADLLNAIASIQELYIPVIVLGEFRFGIERSRHRSAYEAWLKEVLTSVVILPVLESTTTHYARICGVLKARGRPIPTNDAWIAALGLEHRLPILSRDSHFDDIPEIAHLAW